MLKTQQENANRTIWCIPCQVRPEDPASWKDRQSWRVSGCRKQWKDNKCASFCSCERGCLFGFVFSLTFAIYIRVVSCSMHDYIMYLKVCLKTDDHECCPEQQPLLHPESTYIAKYVSLSTNFILFTVLCAAKNGQSSPFIIQYVKISLALFSTSFFVHLSHPSSFSIPTISITSELPVIALANLTQLCFESIHASSPLRHFHLSSHISPSTSSWGLGRFRVNLLIDLGRSLRNDRSVWSNSAAHPILIIRFSSHGGGKLTWVDVQSPRPDLENPEIVPPSSIVFGRRLTMSGQQVSM